MSLRRFEGKYTLKVDGMEQALAGAGTMTMASVGKSMKDPKRVAD